MVGNLTVGKKKYEDVEEDIKKIISSSEKLRYELSQLIDYIKNENTDLIK